MSKIINKKTIIFFTLCLFSQTNAIAKEKQIDPEAKQQAALLKQLFSKGGLFGEIQPSSTPINDTLDPTPLPTNVSEDEINQALTLFSNAFYLKKIFDEAKIEFDNFLLPNYAYATITNQWQSVKSKKGVELIGKIEKEKENSSFKMFNYSEVLLKKFNEEEDPLYEAKGKATVKIPEKFLRIDVSISDLKKPITIDDYELTLHDMKNDYAKLQVNAKEGVDLSKQGIVVIPLGKQGRLKTTENSESPTSVEMPDFIVKAIEDLESGKKSVKEMTAEFSQKQHEMENIGKKNERIFATKAIGTITSLAVFIPEEFVNETIEVTATTEPKVDREKPEVLRASRYMNNPKPNFQDLTLEELKKHVQCKSDRSRALIGYNTPEVVCELPKISNSEYASVEFKNPVLLDKNKKTVAFKLETGGYSPETYSAEIRFYHKNSDAIVSFAKATGTVHIRYPIKIETLKIKKSESNEAEMSFEGYFVKYNKEKLIKPESFFANINPVRAFDNSGRELFKFSYSSYESSEKGEFETVAFWGYPEMVEMDSAVEWAEFDLNYELAPAKILDKNKGFIGF
jgi:hypothetical protein